MHLLSVFFVILLSVCSTLATYVQKYDFPDGTYAYANYWPVSSEPTPQDQAAYANAAYQEMITKATNDGVVKPSTMSVAYWPNKDGRGGTMILHSSIRGGFENSDSANYINTCNIGAHRYRGMCGEIANMVWAKSLQDQGLISTNSQVRWSIYGVTDEVRGTTDWMAPCGDQSGKKGCASYVDKLKRESGGGGTCIMKREPAVVPVKPAPKPVPEPGVPVTPDVPVNPNGPDSPTTPDTPDRLVPGGPKNPADPATPNSPERLVPGTKDPADPANPNGDKVLEPSKDKPDSDREKGFEDGVVCKLPTRKPGPPMADIPDPSGLANFMPPPDNKNAAMMIRRMTAPMMVRGATWNWML